MNSLSLLSFYSIGMNVYVAGDTPITTINRILSNRNYMYQIVSSLFQLLNGIRSNYSPFPEASRINDIWMHPLLDEDSTIEWTYELSCEKVIETLEFIIDWSMASYVLPECEGSFYIAGQKAIQSLEPLKLPAMIDASGCQYVNNVVDDVLFGISDVQLRERFCNIPFMPTRFTDCVIDYIMGMKSVNRTKPFFCISDI